MLISSRTPPGAGNGTIVNSELKVARFKLTDSVNFATQGANLSWRNSIDPFTKVNAYVNGFNTSITNSSNHINQLDNLPLPVELSNFSAIVNNEMINLNWQTKTEMNNYGFEIERKTSDTQAGEKYWEKIGFVAGYGSSESHKDYSFTDKAPTGGTIFIYRLKQIDLSGSFKYSDEVEVELAPNEFALYQNYPNPFNPSTSIQYAIANRQFVTLKIYDVLGTEITTLVNEEKPAGVYNVEFRIDNLELSSGIYFYRLQAGDFVETKKMILLK